MLHNLIIQPNNYVYGLKFNTYLKKYDKTMLILLSEIDGKYTFNLASNIWKQININNKIHLQIITIPSESKIYYNGVNYYTDTINLKKI